MGDLGARVGAREQPLRPLDRGQHHVDGDISIRVAVDLDARPMHPLDPGVEVVLRLGDVAFVRRLDAGIRRAERHRALRERPVDGVLGGGSQPDPLVAEAGRDAAGDHRLQHLAAGLVAHPVQEVSARPHLLQGEQIAALVMHARQAIADELLGDVGQPIAVALQRLFRGKGRPLADLVERVPSPGR